MAAQGRPKYRTTGPKLTSLRVFADSMGLESLAERAGVSAIAAARVISGAGCLPATERALLAVLDSVSGRSAV